MSVEIEGVRGNDIYDRHAEMLYSLGVSGQKFYDTIWTKGIEETCGKIFHDGGQFDKSQLDAVINELKRLHDWAGANLDEKDKGYMQWKIENLLNTLPGVFEKYEDIILYIY